MTMIPMTNEFDALLRADLYSFIERAFYELNPETAYVPAWHIELIAAKLEACARGDIRRLIINLPPRHLKSHCISIAFVAWYLGHYAARHVICASYGKDLAEKLARDCRSLMQSAWYQAAFATRLSPVRQAVDDFMTTELGTRLATSVGGVLTGRGADLIVIDDPLKPDEALSESQRKAVNSWYDNSLLSRLNDKNKGCIIVTMQRLHQDDLVGHVLEQEGWDVLSLPAIAEEPQSFVFHSALGKRIVHRRIDEPLHAGRESLAILENIRRTIGEYNFASQYQQSPIAQGGAIIKAKWLLTCEPADWPTSFTRIVQSWDTANKATEFSDFSVCTTWGVKDKRFYLLDVVRKRLEFPDLKKAVIAQRERWNANKVLIEDKASGTQLIQELKREGVPNIEPYMPLPNMDKQMRLHAQSTAFESGQVLLPKYATWLDDYTRELLGFPGSKHDDQVDSTTQALHYLRKQRPSLYDML
jgi:predicted phage terminase large subunit-like protein